MNTHNDFVALQMLVEAGCSDVVQDKPRGWLKTIETPPAALNRAFEPVRPVTQPAPALALDAITNLTELRAAVDAFESCALKRTATKTVFADGSADNRIMLIGEAPGADEDRQGIPFVGEAGEVLNKMLAAIDLARPDVYVTNMVFWRPPGNRVPTAEEILQCLPFVKKQIELVNPRVILTLGNVPSKSLLDTDEGITRLRGKLSTLRVANKTYPLLPTFHPAYLLRQPAHKAMSWADLLLFRSLLDTHYAD